MSRPLSRVTREEFERAMRFAGAAVLLFCIGWFAAAAFVFTHWFKPFG